MKNDWLKDIRDRMGNYETDAPEGLWEGICEAMPGMNGGKHIQERRGNGKIITLLRTAGVAAAACIVIVLALHINNIYDDKPLATDIIPAQKRDSGMEKRMQARLTDTDINDIPSTKNPVGVQSVTGGLPTIIALSSGNDNAAEQEEPAINAQPSTEESRLSEAEQRKDSQESSALPRTHGSDTRYPSHTSSDRSRSNKASRWSIGTGVAGVTGASSDPITKGYHASDPGGVTADWRDNPMLGIAVLNQGKETEREYEHHLPIRMGITLAYRLDDRWSIETGVTYTRLSSDTKEGTESNYLTGNQRLHYVGIPVNVKYNAISFSRLSLYASAGVLTEKCVSGDLTRGYVINNANRKTEKLTIESKPLQFSVNAAAGVQYDVVKNIGIFVEPGLSYYFDDRSSLSTIYKDKPLNFSLNLGLRCTLDGR